jgi:hypothetical protein
VLGAALLAPATLPATRALLAAASLAPLAIHAFADVDTPRGRVRAAIAHGGCQTILLLGWTVSLLAYR